MPSGQIAFLNELLRRFVWAYWNVWLVLKPIVQLEMFDEYEYSYVRLDIDRKAIAKTQRLAFIPSTGLSDVTHREELNLTTLIGSRLKNVTKSRFSPKAAQSSLEQPWLGCSSKRWKLYLQLFFPLLISCNRERQESLSVSSCMLNLTIGMQKQSRSRFGEDENRKRVEMAMKGESAIGDVSASASTTRNFQLIAQPPETCLDERCTRSRCVQGHACFLLWWDHVEWFKINLPAGSLNGIPWRDAADNEA